MQPSEITEKPVVRLWTPGTIGWLTLFFGYASGFLLAAINWHRMGLRRKAGWHLAIALVFTLLWPLLQAVYEYEWEAAVVAAYPYYAWARLGGRLLLSFGVVAYLYTTTAADVAAVGNRAIVQHHSGWAAAAIALATLLAVMGIQLLISLGAVYVQATLEAPKPTSTQIQGGNSAIIGTVRAWAEAPVAQRQVVLCQLYRSVEKPPYACQFTDYVTTTDGDGHFQFEQVPAGWYLLFYSSGVGNFDRAVNKFANKDFVLGNYSWLSAHSIFADSNIDGSFAIYAPSETQAAREFYWKHSELTLMAEGSPFFVAHDVQTAIAKGADLGSGRLSSVFIPVVAEVGQGYTSQVEFFVVSP